MDPGEKTTFGGVLGGNVSPPRLTNTNFPPVIGHLEGAATRTGGPEGVVATGGKAGVVATATELAEGETTVMDVMVKEKAENVLYEAKSALCDLLASSSACVREEASTRTVTRLASTRRVRSASRIDCTSTQLMGTEMARAMATLSC